MAITYEPRLALPQWGAGSDPFTRAQMDDAFAKLGNLAGRGEQGPLSQLPAPATPTTTTATTGGTLAPATYAYRITALSPAGGSFAAGETTPSGEVTRIVPAGTSTNTVTVNWTAVPGATGYRIYGRTAGAELLLATVGAVTTWTDTGAGTPAGAMPATNTTSGRPAPGIRNRTYWATDDRGGRYSYDDGTNWNDLGPSPVAGPVTGATALIVGHAAAATSDAVLIGRGKTGQTGDLLKLQDPTATTDYLRVSSAGAFVANAGATVRPASTSAAGLVINGLSSQTGDLLSAQVNGGIVASLTAAGGHIAAGADHYFGPGAYGANNSRFRITALSTTDVGLLAENPVGGNASLRLRPAGTGSVSLQSTGGLDIAQTDGSTTTLRLLQSPGSDLTSHPSGVALSARGLSVTADSATIQGSPSAGLGVAINRGAPALSINNATGPLVQGWAGATQRYEVGTAGVLKASGDDHYIGRAAFGATGMRLHILATTGAGGVGLRAETQAGTVGSSGGVGELVLGLGGVVVGGGSSQDVMLGQASATNSTGNFPWMPAISGAPTGAVTNPGGSFSTGVPFIYDSSNHKFWVRDGGAWRGVVLT